MDRAHEVWAEALWVERHKGSQAQKFIAERIVDLAHKRDEAGIARWKRIAAAYDQLQMGRRQ